MLQHLKPTVRRLLPVGDSAGARNEARQARRAPVLLGLALAVVLALSAAIGASQAAAVEPSFVDPTASGFEDVELGELDYVAPFAVAESGGDDDGASITIGDESDVQDSVLLDAERGAIDIGEQVALADGSAVRGPASVGEGGACPKKPGTKTRPLHCPSFVGFNAVVDGAIIEKDAMVIHMARVAPGVRIPSGRKVLPGKFVRNQSEMWRKTAQVDDLDREFMAGVVKVNTEFAEAYTELAAEDPSNVFGINLNPDTPFNDEDEPSFAGVPTRDPGFRNRIIGDVQLADTQQAASAKMGDLISLRADEGDPFRIGTIRSPGGEDHEGPDAHAGHGHPHPGMGDRHTMHALEHTEVQLGDDGAYGFHTLVHAGPAFDPTRTGDDFTLADLSVFFNSSAGNDVRIGAKSLVQQAKLDSGDSVPRCTVQVGTARSPVEWCDVPFPRLHSEEDPEDDRAAGTGGGR